MDCLFGGAFVVVIESGPIDVYWEAHLVRYQLFELAIWSYLLCLIVCQHFGGWASTQPCHHTAAASCHVKRETKSNLMLLPGNTRVQLCYESVQLLKGMEAR